MEFAKFWGNSSVENVGDSFIELLMGLLTDSNLILFQNFLRQHVTLRNYEIMFCCKNIFS